jgi:hypothetical protein
MRFSSLSEAIKYHTQVTSKTDNIAPYGSLAAELSQIPVLNTNYITPQSPNAITYGVTIWGLGKITEVNKPEV